MKLERVIISGGGTGGHIFPAVAIADEIKRRNPDANILFIGAEGKMEMEKVPEAGYAIIGLPIAGFQRKFTLSNLLLPIKILKSLSKARRILKEFDPQAVIGVGGYASGPTLKVATWLSIPTLVQEQNSFPGKTNILLSKSVTVLCTAYDGMEKYFPSSKIRLTGNPVRREMVKIDGKRVEAQEYYKLDAEKQTVLIIGGSLGARTLNRSVTANMQAIADNKDVQFLWQSGKLYYEQLLSEWKDRLPENIRLVQFIDRMDLAYAAADVIISRAGAISVSELCLIGKPVILVPSPNVAEDHQTKNALALVQRNAALLVKDSDSERELISEVFELIENQERRKELSIQIVKLGKPEATEAIVNELEKIV
ncbi:MAG: undecaprenyldiphospho-muramoylpentapeptide beta-N-acetylglucosaminyltransferase [Cryomorphaceae bacterium]|jgi:UDP-N-acetylglucosamine--N-acetylmuramyl-(pentapeptide) pyrophosphoryl-undecaprenol N-acetylglucosamine transferase|nr:undecaprenyldiphospho-muramoylpentapeptide beta-N-acetylglucosaminyltransferase [Cryomorphaceae bacterium]